MGTTTAESIRALRLLASAGLTVEQLARLLTPSTKLRRAAAVHIDDGRWLFDRYRRGRALP